MESETPTDEGSFQMITGSPDRTDNPEINILVGPLENLGLDNLEGTDKPESRYDPEEPETLEELEQQEEE